MYGGLPAGTRPLNGTGGIASNRYGARQLSPGELADLLAQGQLIHEILSSHSSAREHHPGTPSCHAGCPRDTGGDESNPFVSHGTPEESPGRQWWGGAATAEGWADPAMWGPSSAAGHLHAEAATSSAARPDGDPGGDGHGSNDGSASSSDGEDDGDGDEVGGGTAPSGASEDLKLFMAALTSAIKGRRRSKSKERIVKDLSAG